MAVNNGFPSYTTGAQGIFNGASSEGYIQGQAHPDPATRWALRSGILGANETIPMWGGVAVSAAITPIATGATKNRMGQILTRSTTLASIDGFSVFDQAYNMVIDPSNPVPTAGSGQSVNYYPLGCRARIPVLCDPSLISLRAGQINPQVSWDSAAQMLVPYTPANPAITITGAAWANTSGGQITFTVSTNPTTYFSAGSDIETSGIVSTGGTGGSYNGQWVVVSTTSTTIVVAAVAATGFYGTYSSGGTVLAGGGALPVVVLDIAPTGNMTVAYNATTGLVSWNYSGACALIQLTGGTVA